MPTRIDRGSDDPRGVAEKARADLKASTELGLAPQEDETTREPSTTPATFGESTGAGFKDDPRRRPEDDADAMSRAKE